MDSQLRDGVWATKQIDLVALIGQVTTLRKVTPHEYAGPCPKCGGHDRLHVNDQRGFFCRQCYNERAWYDAIDFRRWMFGESLNDAIVSLVGRRGLDPVQIAKIQAEREARERDQAAEAMVKLEAARKTLQQREPWKAYHENLTDLNRDLWRERGLSDDWQDYFKVGYCQTREWVTGDTVFESDSLTIPYMRYTGPGEFECISIKHRLLVDNPPGGKYRPEMSGLGNQLFTPWYEERLNKNILIVEGEIKAMVVFASLWVTGEPIAPNMSIVGIPGANLKQSHIDEFTDAERIWVCLDPDAQKAARGLAQTLDANRCAVINLPEKVDDLIVKGILDGFDLLRLLRGYDGKGY